MEAARTVLVGSRHTAESLWETVDDAGLAEKTRLGPPGVDVEAFAPLPAAPTPPPSSRRLARTLESADAGRPRPRPAPPPRRALRSYAAAAGPRVIFVGKLIVSKGCDLLLAAWPLVAAPRTPARGC